MLPLPEAPQPSMSTITGRPAPLMGCCKPARSSRRAFRRTLHSASSNFFQSNFHSSSIKSAPFWFFFSVYAQAENYNEKTRQKEVIFLFLTRSWA